MAVNVIVVRGKNESLESLWIRFDKAVKKAGILKDVQKNEDFTKKHASKKHARKSGDKFHGRDHQTK